MSGPLPSGGMAVMASRREPPDSLNFFPTPPWATRALFAFVGEGRMGSVWEPACGEGHMAEVLRECFSEVAASDVFDYGKGYEVGSFVGEGLGTLCGTADWIITNPPFNLAAEFARRALEQATVGVALLTRTAWLEGGERYATLFSQTPPSVVALFAERVPMVKGRWDPQASTATSYAWVVWRIGHQGPTTLRWIQPGRRAALTKPDDIARFAGNADSRQPNEASGESFR